MFTGIIETVGEVAEVKPTPAGFRLRLHTDLSSELTPGESMADEVGRGMLGGGAAQEAG